MNSLIMSKENKSAIKTFSTRTSPRPDGFSGKFHHTFKEELTLFFLKIFKEIKEGETHYSSS